VEKGWVAYECDYLQSASMTLEYAYEDSCVAVVAEAAGRGDRAAFYRARSGNWKNVFDPSVGMARPRWRDGSWLSPFDPTALAGFTEANSWQYTWSVQHDVCGLVAAMGGREAFARKLDEFFDGRHFTADNEPDFHVPWLYGYVGLPSRAQTRVAEVRRDRFGDRPDGLPGNDDAGATSAWYAFAAMGFYPVAPGEEWYWLNAPAFDRVTIHLEPDRAGGRAFVIEAPGASAGKVFARGVTLDGEALTEARIPPPAGGRAAVRDGGRARRRVGAADLPVITGERSLRCRSRARGGRPTS